ncbi:nitrate- and nitrite sensing domain-containing protein [Actinoplanes oblitus]|uniref:histidine kinase n=1 Tax=Actinoplanes oblitus TaxID=3040509 RepID=A0ABY8WH06_9ACTN|nr:nitrate- and nitrite sensing domain-containing protein [Actinoplanes oblitus]WIM97164.1 nitrate- and nitrite sensing domain-containing protein [Actinoplanes oblitus]
MSTGSSALAVRRGPFSRLRDAGIRTKLAFLLIIPITAVLVLASVRLMDVRGRATDAGRVADLTVLGNDVSELARLLHRERMAAAAYLAAPDVSPDAYRQTAAAVDARVQTFRAHRDQAGQVPARVRDRLGLIQERLDTLAGTRDDVSARQKLTMAAAVQRYSSILEGLSDYDDSLSQVAEPGVVADGLRALAAFSRIESAAADQEAAAYTVRMTGLLSGTWQQQLIGAQAARQEALDDLRQIATAEQAGLVEGTLANAAVARADGLITRLTGPAAVSDTELTEAYQQVLDLLRATGTRLEADAVRVSRDDSDSTAERATVEFVVVLLVLLAAIALGVYLARTLHLSVRRLREGALAVANRDLPDAVHRLKDVDSLDAGGVDQIIAQSRDPIRLADRDEFGQVAEAFNMVHREAIRVAAEQAALRTSVSAMFLSLARRSQALVDRMIGELDHIERTEEDPKRLAKLFDLDHLATRMRRNDENLLVLAGADVGAPRREDALLIDALRAAQSEVELYHRIEFGALDADVSVVAAAVNDVVRLLAELLDNATRFSPPTTVVVAHGRRSGDHAVLQIEDRGLGITPEQLEQINRRLSEPAEVDASAFRLMGFAVIARLAARHGIGVRLLPSREGGTVAEVTLPADIVVLPGAPSSTAGRAASWTRPGPAPQPVGGRAPETRAPVRSAPMPAPVSPRWAPPVDPGPPAELDLRPTPDRPPLPTRVPRPPTAEPDSTPLFAPVSAQPAPDSTPLFAPVSAQPAPDSTPLFAPVSAQPAPDSTPRFPPVSAQPAPVSAQPVPIRMEMQHTWFDAEMELPEMQGMPTAGYAPAPVSAAPAGPPPVAPEPAAPEPVAASAVPRPRPAADDDERWRSAADEGWARAMAAAAPQDAGTTRSGLPKRIPQAQLVPGGVRDLPRAQHRRSPDDVRGLLAAYTSGVRRGRTDGSVDQVPKESEQ